jgi:hypothetical protein
MCDQRERLIEYLYGEADAADLAEVGKHVDQCHDCRAEIAALRSVRNDLLAWQVPDHEPIWRPAPLSPPLPFWHRVPGWGLAAAAMLVFATGLGGGMATRYWIPQPAATTALVQPAPAAGPELISLTPDDLTRLKADILATVRTEMESRLQTVSTTPSVPSGLVPVRETTNDLAERLAAIERWKDDQITLNALFNGQFGRLNRVTSDLNEFAQQSSRMQPVSFNPGGR